MRTDLLKDRRCLALSRVSKRKQAKHGLPQQTAWLKEYAETNGMIWAGDMKESLAVSQTKKRPDVEKVLARKAALNDFDTVLVQDLSRLTRGGIEHGFDLYKRFKNAGILIVSVLDGLIDGEDKLEQALKRFKEARAAMHLTAMVVSRGGTEGRAVGRSAYSRQIPYGVDRLITDADGLPLHVLRNLPNGSQQQLDLLGTVMKTFLPNQNGLCRHYVRQDGELVTLIKGSSEAVAVVRHIFRRKYVDGWGLNRITRELNDLKWVAPRGGTWSRSSVRTIFTSPIYLGIGVRNQQATGEYWKLGTDNQPLPKRDRDPQSRNSEWIDSFRPESEWLIIKYEDLKNMLDTGLDGHPEPCLDADYKARVEMYQMNEKRRLASGRLLRRGGDKHRQSSFILKGVLRSKQGDYEMTGRSFTTNGSQYRYYAVSRGRSNPSSGTKLSTLIPADLLEAEVLKAVRQTLENYDAIEPVIRTNVEAQVNLYQSKKKDGPALLKGRERVIAQIDFWVGQLDELGRDTVAARVQPLKEEAKRIQRLLNTEQLPVAVLPHDFPNDIGTAGFDASEELGAPVLGYGDEFLSVADFGNTSSSTIPLALASIASSGAGVQRLGLCAFGAGHTFGAAILEHVGNTNLSVIRRL